MSFCFGWFCYDFFFFFLQSFLRCSMSSNVVAYSYVMEFAISELFLVFPIQLFKSTVFIQPGITTNVAVNNNCFYQMLRGLFF